MDESVFVNINEIILQAEKESGKIIILKQNKESVTSLTMFVGELEFLAIAKEQKLIQTPRPLTHELYLSILTDSGIEFQRVEIYDLREQAFFARVLYQKEGIETIADARPSDAIALALNRHLPIWVHSKLLRKELSSEQVEVYKDFIKTVKF
jgi:bifunctional DNase/RNase